MFRSGTTLIARMLNTHPEIILASDTLIEFFRMFRNEIYAQNEIKIPSKDLPLEDFFKSKNQKSRKLIDESNFKIPIINTDLEELKNLIKNRSELFSPVFCNNLESFNGETFAEIFDELLFTMKKSYIKENSKVLGFKVTWSEQFATTFLNKFSKNGKVLFVIRDPRATIGSNFAMRNHRYPLEFLIRNWRKSVLYAILCSKIISKYQDNVMILNYENLIEYPEIEIKKIIKFLELEFSDKLLDPKNFKDGGGKSWTQNSSFKQRSSTFNKNAINNWRKVIDKKTQKFIEYACFPEMILMGYKPELVSKEDLKKKCNYPLDVQNEIAVWIQKFYSLDQLKDQNWLKNVEKSHKKRNEVLLLSLNNQSYVEENKKIIEEYFIDIEYFKYLQNMNLDEL